MTNPNPQDTEPLKKVPTRRVTHEGIETITHTTEDLANALNVAITRINSLTERVEQLEARYEAHYHDPQPRPTMDGPDAPLGTYISTTPPKEQSNE